MGGDSSSPPCSTENYPLSTEVSSDEERSENKSPSNDEFVFGEFSGIDELLSEAKERQKAKVYSEVMKSYEDLQSRIDNLEEARNKILSYKPGLSADHLGSIDLSKSRMPKSTTLLLIGPKGSGKSSLVNKISRVLETGAFVPGRAQVSCDSLRDGTYFLYEYMIPRASGSFCLYDTRGLSDDLSENEKIFEHWMTKGVRHGELVERKSDNADLKARMKHKVRKGRSSSSTKAVNFVIFVISGIYVLESMISPDGNKTDYAEMVAENFHNALLSFQDEKPVVVVTHGDLLPLADRIRIRVFLGSLLRIPPASQIFDIPDTDDPATTMAVLSMLNYSLEHADRYLHPNHAVKLSSTAGALFLLAVVAFFFVAALYMMYHPSPSPTPNKTSTSQPKIEWHKIRHLWSD